MAIAIILSITLGLVHFWNEKIFFKKRAPEIKVRSFVAGVSIAYVFLFLLPGLYRGVAVLDQWIFIFILFGFSAVHLLEKYFYQHVEGEERLFRFKEVHYMVFLLYYFLLGMIFVNLLRLDVFKGILFYIPILFYAAVSRVSFAEVHTHIRALKILRVALALAALAGVLAASSFLVHPLYYNVLLAFVIGAFLYIAIKDFIPKEAKGSPSYFMLGAALYTFFIMLSFIF